MQCTDIVYVVMNKYGNFVGETLAYTYSETHRRAVSKYGAEWFMLQNEGWAIHEVHLSVWVNPKSQEV